MIFVNTVMSLLFNMLSRMVKDFLPRSKHPLISCLQSQSAVILKPPQIESLTVSIVSPYICHEVMGKKVITNLDSIFKRRDITWPTKVHLVKAMVFPVVMYGYESWTMKKAEHQRIDAFEL